MLRYKLASLADKPKKPYAFLPEIHGSHGQEAAYLKVMRSMLRQLAAQVRSDVLPVVERELAEQKQVKRLQVDIDADIFNRLSAFAAMLARVADNMVNRILRIEGNRHTREFGASVRRAIGVDVGAVVREGDLESLMSVAAVRNAALIKGLADETVRRVANTVTTALMQGTPARDLRKALAKDFSFSDKRAKVIARDQIAKLNSDMNRFRHRQAGIDKYRWRTSKDERVRPLHRKLDGKIYEYGKPTGAENGLPPGQPVLCRCIAQAIVEF
jgi:SPP1 gp7 family putative phage head morphogenesis protein